MIWVLLAFQIPEEVFATPVEVKCTLRTVDIENRALVVATRTCRNFVVKITDETVIEGMDLRELRERSILTDNLPLTVTYSEFPVVLRYGQQTTAQRVRQ